MLVGVRICEIFSRKSSLKDRALRASLFPRMLPLWPDDPGAPGVTCCLSPFSVGPPEPGELLLFCWELLVVLVVQFPPELLVMLDALLRGVVWADVEMVTLDPDVALSQSFRLLLVPPDDGPVDEAAGALDRSPFGVAIVDFCLRFYIQSVEMMVYLLSSLMICVTSYTGLSFLV